MDSTLPKNQLIPDNRYYIVRYTPVKTLQAQRPKHQYKNSSDLNLMIDDLKPNTEYEFTAKIVKGRRQQSSWSLVVTNKTTEAAPASPPRDLHAATIDTPAKDSALLTWRPPKASNGKVNGYLIQYTTDRWANDRDWFVKAVVGDLTSTTIDNLVPDKKYYFKISARNGKGYGPSSPVLSYLTAVVYAPEPQDRSPVVLYAILGVCAGIILMLIVGGVCLIRCKLCKKSEPQNLASNKSYLIGESSASGQREKLNPPPPDLWIGHDQLELKEMDETGETSLARSTPDYRSASSMDRSRNYINPYSGKNIILNPFFLVFWGFFDPWFWLIFRFEFRFFPPSRNRIWGFVCVDEQLRLPYKKQRRRQTPGQNCGH